MMLAGAFRQDVERRDFTPSCRSSISARWARVAGIVGAGGNVGAVLAGFLFKSAGVTWPQALLILGCIVLAISSLSVFVRFSESDERVAREEIAARLGAQFAPAAVGAGD